MAHTFTSIITHIVFSTKNRIRIIDDELRQRLVPYMGGTIRSLGGTMIRVEAVAGHAHLLVAVPSALSIAEAVQKIKGGSSKWIHETWPERSEFAWQKGYGAFSVSRSHVPTVARYIENQEWHHRRRTFEDEFLELLRRHGIEYDERYLWR